MSAINLYPTKAEALYFKDSQINSFYEFGAIQLVPNNSYTQKALNIKLGDRYIANVHSVYDDSLLGTVPITVVSDEINGNELYADSTSIYADANTTFVSPYLIGDVHWSIAPVDDFGVELVYLRLVYGTSIHYSNPMYITALSEEKTTKFTYKDAPLSQYQSISLKAWFRQKSRQSELTTYYESSTKNTVTQAIKTHNLEMYESELMSMDDLILTAQILESPYLYIEGKRYSLFEAIKLPELTQQENFGKIKFTLSPHN